MMRDSNNSLIFYSQFIGLFSKADKQQQNARFTLPELSLPHNEDHRCSMSKVYLMSINVCDKCIWRFWI